MPELAKPIIEYGQTQTGFDNFLKGFQLMAAMNAKKNANERMIMQLDEKIRNDNLTHEMAMQKAENTASHYRDMYDLGTIANDIKETKAKSATDQLKGALDDTRRLTEMQDKIYNIEAPKGSTDWKKQRDDIVSQYTDITGNIEPKRVLDRFDRDWKTARTEGFKTFNSRMQGMGFGQVGMGIFDNPQAYQQADEKGQMVFKVPDAKGVATTVKVDKSKYDELKKGYQEYYGGMSAPVDNPNHSSEWQKAKAAMSTRDPIQVKKLYQSKGFNPAELDSDTAP